MKAKVKELSSEQKKQVDKLRKGGMSIKAIAKTIHVSDKRVSAYLVGGKSECSCHGKQLPPKKGTDPFLEMVNLAIENFGESVSNCIELLDASVLGCLLEVLEGLGGKKGKPKKEVKKSVYKRLDNLFNGFSKAMYDAAIAMIFTMPPQVKRLWVDSINRNPREAGKKGKK